MTEHAPRPLPPLPPRPPAKPGVVPDGVILPPVSPPPPPPRVNALDAAYDADRANEAADLRAWRARGGRP